MPKCKQIECNRNVSPNETNVVFLPNDRNEKDRFHKNCFKFKCKYCGKKLDLIKDDYAKDEGMCYMTNDGELVCRKICIPCLKEHHPTVHKIMARKNPLPLLVPVAAAAAPVVIDVGAKGAKAVRESETYKKGKAKAKAKAGEVAKKIGKKAKETAKKTKKKVEKKLKKNPKTCDYDSSSSMGHTGYPSCYKGDVTKKVTITYTPTDEKYILYLCIIQIIYYFNY